MTYIMPPMHACSHAFILLTLEACMFLKQTHTQAYIYIMLKRRMRSTYFSITAANSRKYFDIQYLLYEVVYGENHVR